MSNPTSSFGWIMPTATDLVTDLPADFEVFGQAVDSSMADLLGGTTGQVLKKNTDTDMDFVWAADASGGGKVLQVVYAVTTTSTNIATTSLTSTTLTASITPSSVTSKVLIIANNNIYNDTSGRGAAAAITTGATTLIHQNDTNNGGTFNLSDSRGTATIPIQFLHSPATTSSITYTIKATSLGAGNVTFQNGSSPSNILLFEIGA